MRVALLLAGLLAGPALADPAADPARGAQLAGTCIACHGRDGEGQALNGVPRLAGQFPAYLAKQLRDFAGGGRATAVMQPFARDLAGQDIDDLAAYYAGLKAPAGRPEPEARLAAQGRQLADFGDPRSGAQACANCHGPGGRGEPPLLPYLAGQNLEYLAGQLQAWRSGARGNDGGGQMQTVVARMSDADIAAVAAYFARLPPPE